MKVLLRTGLGLFLAVVVLLVIVLCRTLTAPVQRYDAELVLPRVNIPQGSNAFDLLQTAASQVWWPKDLDRQTAKLAANTNWDDALAGSVLASNREALVAWDAAVKLPDLQVPEVSTAGDLPPYLADWKKLALLAQVRQNMLLHEGHDQEAFDQMVDEIQLGRRMQNGHGVLIVYLVGSAVNNLGLAQMQRWAGQAHLTPDQLKDYARRIDWPADEAGSAYANSIRVEYQMMVGTLDGMRRGTLTNSDIAVPTLHSWPAWPLFSYGQTRAMFAAGALRLVKAAPHPYGEARIDEVESRPGLLSIVFSGNPIGQILYYMMMPGLAVSLEKKSTEDVQLQATRTILALRAYELAHGQLPVDLPALVPEFLDQVPLDDFNGKPLRYSPDKKIVYSVGKNLKDDGGNGPSFYTSTYAKRLDLVFPFDF
jgi:hypothetical protein